MGEDNYGINVEVVRNYVNSYMPEEYWTHEITVSDDGLRFDVNSLYRAEIERVYIEIKL